MTITAVNKAEVAAIKIIFKKIMESRRGLATRRHLGDKTVSSLFGVSDCMVAD